MKRIVFLLCLVALMVVSPISSIAEEDIGFTFLEDKFNDGEFVDEVNNVKNEQMFVNGRPYVRLRKSDSIDLPYLDKMPYGSKVTVISSQSNDIGEEWSLVIYTNQYGYCMTKFLSYETDIPADETSPLTMEEAFGTTLLQRGNSSSSYRVRNLQLCLIEGGFLSDDKGADGCFGKNTYKALCAFQKSQGLYPAGKAGNTTKKRLWYMYSDFLITNGVMQ